LPEQAYAAGQLFPVQSMPIADSVFLILVLTLIHAHSLPIVHQTGVVKMAYVALIPVILILNVLLGTEHAYFLLLLSMAIVMEHSHHVSLIQIVSVNV